MQKTRHEKKYQRQAGSIQYSSQRARDTGKWLLAAVLTATPALPVLAQSDNTDASTSGGAEVLQAQQYSFNIPSKPLPQAIAALSAVTGIQVLYTEKATFDHTAPALKGNYTVQQALEKLLQGSKLHARFTSAKAVTIEAAATDVMMLQAVEVMGRISRTEFAESSFATTKTETHILDIPQTVNTVTKKIIKDQHLVRLNDIAPYVAGVNEFSVYDDLVIRGFRSSEQSRVNGMRVYNNFWTQPYIANVERVEVIKGPSAVLFGQASPGGVINIVTKKPLAESQNTIRGNVSTFGSGNSQGLIALDSTGPINELGTFLYRFNASSWDEESFRTEVFDQGYNLAPSFSWLPNADTRFNLELNYVDRETVLDRGQPNLYTAPLGTVPIEVSATQPGDALNYQDLGISLSLDHRFSENWVIAAALQYHKNDEDLLEHRVRDQLDASGRQYNVRYGDRASEAETLSTSIYAVGQFKTGEISHKLVFGADTMTQEVERQQLVANDVFIFDVLNPINIRRDISSYSFDPELDVWGSDNQRNGFFIQDQLTLGKWDLLAGFRYSRFNTQPLGEQKSTDSDVTLRLGAVYRYSDQLSFYGTYAEGFEPNFDYSSDEGGPFDPTSSLLYEVGAKYLAFNDQLLATASVYHIVNDDVVVEANDPVNPDLYRQRGQEESSGLELEAVGKVTDRLSIIANYAFNRAIISEDSIPENVGNTKQGAPKHAASIWGSYQINQAFSIGAGAEYIDTRKTELSIFDVPSYTIYNMAIHYKVSRWDLSLLANNITDEEHWTGGYYPERMYPGDPRKLTLSISTQF